MVLLVKEDSLVQVRLVAVVLLSLEIFMAMDKVLRVLMAGVHNHKCTGSKLDREEGHTWEEDRCSLPKGGTISVHNRGFRLTIILVLEVLHQGEMVLLFHKMQQVEDSNTKAMEVFRMVGSKVMEEAVASQNLVT